MGRAPTAASQRSSGERRPLASTTTSAATSPWSVRTPRTRGGSPGSASRPSARTPYRRSTPGSPVAARPSTQSTVWRRVMSSTSRSSPGTGERSASVGGIWLCSVASTAPALRSPASTSGRRSRRISWKVVSRTCGWTICGAAARKPAAAAASTSTAGSRWSASSTVTACPARASRSAADSPPALPPITAIRMRTSGGDGSAGRRPSVAPGTRPDDGRDG